MHSLSLSLCLPISLLSLFGSSPEFVGSLRRFGHSIPPEKGRSCFEQGVRVLRSPGKKASSPEFVGENWGRRARSLDLFKGFGIGEHPCFQVAGSQAKF